MYRRVELRGTTAEKFCCRPTRKGLGKLIMFELKRDPTGLKSIFINDLLRRRPIAAR